MRSISVLALGAALSFGGVATAGSTSETIADFVLDRSGEGFDSNSRDYDILITAVVTADLVGPLADPDADLTLWAPNDGAFGKLADDLGYEGDRSDEEAVWLFLVDALTDLGGGDPIPVLTNVLLYHVAPERVSAIDFILRSFFRQDIETLLTDATFTPRFFRLEDNDPDISDPYLWFPLNVYTGNGYVHTINRVLIPIDIP
jgi:uncharacterized surface protein with fasciclin (FAS1) repeats